MMQNKANFSLSGLRLLVVEDVYLVAEQLRAMLEDLGCDVIGPVATIEQALEIVNGGGLDGALLDANLDGESSAPIAAALNAASVPFIVATGYGGLDLTDEVLNYALRVIKPFSAAQLEATMLAVFAPNS